jgi:hypothetical protein
MRIIAIDPGNIESAWVVFEKRSDLEFQILACGKYKNEVLLDLLSDSVYDTAVIEEMVAYGRVGREVTDTAFWAGRFFQESYNLHRLLFREVFLVNRSKVRGHFGCRKDADIIEKLIERFCPELYAKFVSKELNRPKTINAAREEYFKTFKADIWQAFALGVCWYDLNVH